MKHRILFNRVTPAALILAAALVVGACQPSGSDTPAEKPSTDKKAAPAETKSVEPSKPVAQSPPDEPGESEREPGPVAELRKEVEELREDLNDAKKQLRELDGGTAAEKAPGTEGAGEEPAAEEPAAEKSLPVEKVDSPKADPPAAKGEGDDDEEGAFSLKELEENRKLIQQEMAKAEARRAEEQKKRIAQLGSPLVDNLDKLIRLHKVFPVWTDRQHKRVVMVGEVCQQRVPLEMFACTRNTKEHEAIVVVDTTAQIVHAGLLVIGAKPGKPVRFTPNYTPASGDEIEVTVLWKDADGKVQTARAQDWIRDVRTKKAMTFPWVFAGSGFTKDEYTGKTYYLADGGDFICVSNFATAMLDLPVESSSVNQELGFEAFTERIPERGTPVTMILAPKQDKKPVGEKKAGPDRPSEQPREKPEGEGTKS